MAHLLRILLSSAPPVAKRAVVCTTTPTIPTKILSWRQTRILQKECGPYSR